MGQLMRELHGLKTDNPQAFAHVTANISDELRALAAEQPTENNVERLLAMAERFDRASMSGDLSPFRSNPQPYGHLLRGPWAYRQNNDLQEVGADVQEVIGRVLDDYARTDSLPPTTNQEANETSPGAAAPERLPASRSIKISV